jgi:hypothetical protein
MTGKRRMRRKELKKRRKGEKEKRRKGEKEKRRKGEKEKKRRMRRQTERSLSLSLSHSHSLPLPFFYYLDWSSSSFNLFLKFLCFPFLFLNSNHQRAGARIKTANDTLFWCHGGKKGEERVERKERKGLSSRGKDLKKRILLYAPSV